MSICHFDDLFLIIGIKTSCLSNLPLPDLRFFNIVSFFAQSGVLCIGMFRGFNKLGLSTIL